MESPRAKLPPALITLFGSITIGSAAPDLILHNAKIATVDSQFSIQEAIAIEQGRVVRVGKNRDVLGLRQAGTEVVNLRGRFVVPGLIDSHSHPADACMTEFEHQIPEMHKVADVLKYIRSRAAVVPPGEWITVRQVFITRLAEQRYPTRAELDDAGPNHPVLFATGPDASLNSLALKVSGIGRDFEVTDGGSGFAEKDPQSGEPTGILRNATRYVKVTSRSAGVTQDDRLRRIKALFADYNSVGLTALCDRAASTGEIALFKKLREEGPLDVRVHLSRHIDTIGALDKIQAAIRATAQDTLFTSKDDSLRIIGIKTFLDGGMLTGSAYMREPWGVSRIYAIRDPSYRGVRFIEHDRLVALIRTAVENNLQFTAHSVGDGAVHGLLNAYEEVNQTTPIRATHPCISHSNFMSREAVEQAARLGVMMDIQPAWLYHDAHTLLAQFGNDRMRYFQPLRSIFESGGNVGGGSDHMQKIGSLRSINIYNPFVGMATAVTRKSPTLKAPLHPEESLSREQMIRFYTINNARILRRETDLGSLEPGKLADLAVLDTDLLTCRESRIASTKVLRTYVGGKLVYERK